MAPKIKHPIHHYFPCPNCHVELVQPLEDLGRMVDSWRAGIMFTDFMATLKSPAIKRREITSVRDAAIGYLKTKRMVTDAKGKTK